MSKTNNTKEISHYSKPKQTSLVDVYIGGKIEEKRMLAGLTRGELSVAVGVTHQQMSKYTKAINRVPAARLIEIAGVLNMPLLDFFPDEDSILENTVQTRRIQLKIFEKLNRLSDNDLTAINTLTSTMLPKKPRTSRREC